MRLLVLSVDRIALSLLVLDAALAGGIKGTYLLTTVPL